MHHMLSEALFVLESLVAAIARIRNAFVDRGHMGSIVLRLVVSLVTGLAIEAVMSSVNLHVPLQLPFRPNFPTNGTLHFLRVISGPPL